METACAILRKQSFVNGPHVSMQALPKRGGVSAARAGITRTRVSERAKTCMGPCQEPKPLSAFSPNTHGAYGRASRCRICRSAIMQATRRGEYQGRQKRTHNERTPGCPFVLPAEKACSACQVVKVLGDFAQDTRKPDKHISWCKACKNAQYHARYAAKLKAERKQRRDATMLARRRRAFQVLGDEK